jgi:hypothetical protein
MEKDPLSPPASEHTFSGVYFSIGMSVSRQRQKSSAATNLSEDCFLKQLFWQASFLDIRQW